MYNPSSIHQGLVVQFRVDNRCFLGKMHHFKRSRHMLRMEFSRRHFLKVRSTWLRLPVCSCACTISTLLFSGKWFWLQWLNCSKSLNLRTLGWHLKQQMVDFGCMKDLIGTFAMLDDMQCLRHLTDLFCPNRFPVCSPFSKKSACFKFFKFYMPSSLSNHQSASGQSREGSCGVSV